MAGVDKLRQKLAARRDAEQQRIAAAKQAAPDKEPFSLDALERHLDLTGALGKAPNRELLAAELERDYYLAYPEVQTLAEFAQKKQQAETWS